MVAGSATLAQVSLDLARSCANRRSRGVVSEGDYAGGRSSIHPVRFHEETVTWVDDVIVDREWGELEYLPVEGARETTGGVRGRAIVPGKGLASAAEEAARSASTEPDKVPPVGSGVIIPVPSFSRPHSAGSG